MDDFPGLLARDFGFRSQGKAAPMAASKGSNTGTLNFGVGSGNEGGRSSSFSSSNRSKSTSNSNSTWSSNQVGGSSFLDDDGLLRSSSAKNHDFDVFGGPPKHFGDSLDYDSIFEGTKNSSDAKSASSSMPVYDKPMYDDDIFDGVPGLKSTSSVNYDDVFTSISSAPKPPNDRYDDFLGNLGKNDPPQSKNSSGARSPKSDHYDDLLGNLGRNDQSQSKTSSGNRSEQTNKGVSDFDDLLPGFGSSSPQKTRGIPETSRPHQSTGPSNKSTSAIEDPFVIIEQGSVPSHDSSDLLGDPLEQINKLNKPDKAKFNGSSGAGVFGDDSFDDLANSVPSYSSSVKNREEDKQPLKTDSNTTPVHRAAGEEPSDVPFFKTAKSVPPKVEVSPKSEVNLDSADDIWITVSEVPLFTQPTNAPPPSRPPPPRPVHVSKIDGGSFSARNTKEKISEFSSFQQFSPSYENHTAVPSSARNMGVSSIDELEDFAMGRSRDHSDSHADVLSSEEEVDTTSAAASAAAMKEAMDRAEAKFKHAREVRERESAKTGRSREVAPEKDEKALRDAQERELREKQERLDREREQREREEKERERRRMEKERERTKQVMERAQREARERAAVEARQKAQKEARERAERAAVQRAQAEARERAATDARERAERAAAEAKERSNAEAREKAAAVAKAETEVRLRAERASAERAAAEARERAAREHQQKNENDLESFFGMGARPSSAPRPNRTTTSESPFDAQFQSRPAPEGARRTSSGASSTIRKASSTTNMVDDLTSIFGGAPSAGEFQEIEGESEERRRARLERHQRTQERAAKALAEKNERDRQTQRDQAERHRLAETLDIEIKRWSAGKEGNLRALLSTMQYILWPECGWQPVSLTDLITAAAVKKAYRKATLCIHPDKVQQKGATLQQKYISEKVFDLLKEAWNKFNSEELF